MNSCLFSLPFIVVLTLLSFSYRPKKSLWISTRERQRESHRPEKRERERAREREKETAGKRKMSEIFSSKYGFSAYNMPDISMMSTYL